MYSILMFVWCFEPDLYVLIDIYFENAKNMRKKVIMQEHDQRLISVSQLLYFLLTCICY